MRPITWLRALFAAFKRMSPSRATSVTQTFVKYAPIEWPNSQSPALMRKAKMPAPIKVNPAKSYKTRCGYTVTRIARRTFVEPDAVLDGFPWKVFYRDLPTDKERFFWANNQGAFFNGYNKHSDLDLIEV